MAAQQIKEHIMDGTFRTILEPEVATDCYDVIIFVHGIGSYSACFDQLSHFMCSKGCKTVNYDLIGRGSSQFHPTGKFGAAEHIDQLKQLLLSLNLKQKVVLIAHSMGGALAVLFTAENADLVKSLVLLSPAGLMHMPALPILRNCKCLHGLIRRSLDTRQNLEKVVREDFFSHRGTQLEYENKCVDLMLTNRDAHPSTSFEAFWQCVLQFPLVGISQQAKQVASFSHLNILILWGREDIAVPMKPSLQRWRHIMEQGSCTFHYKVYDRAAHGFYLEYPDEVAQDIYNFLYPELK